METVDNNGSTSNKICVGGINNNMSYSEYYKQCQYYEHWFLSAVSGFVITLFTSFLRFSATCGCTKGKSYFQQNCFGERIRKIIDFFGGIVLFTFSCKLQQLFIINGIIT